MNHVFYGVNVANCEWKDGLRDIFQKGSIYSKKLGQTVTLYDVLFRQLDPEEIDMLSDEYPNVSAYLDSMELDVGANSGKFFLGIEPRFRWDMGTPESKLDTKEKAEKFIRDTLSPFCEVGMIDYYDII